MPTADLEEQDLNSEPQEEPSLEEPEAPAPTPEKQKVHPDTPLHTPPGG